jgi:uncharacterized protein
MSAAIQVEPAQLAEFCRRHHIRKLALFGSAVRNDFRSDSDLDFLVEFDPERRPGMVELYEIERQLSALYGGRRVDLVNPKYLNRRIRDRVLAEAEVQFCEHTSSK